MFPDLGAKYIHVKEIGTGGTGIVNLAVDTHTGFQVAVKSLFKSHFENNPAMLKRFRIEANIYLMLSHPNIVKLKNFILKDGAHLVMDYIEGMTLEEYIRTVTGPIPSEVAIAIIKDIASAIGYAHQKKIPIAGYNGVLHLDIKPNNILISDSGKVMVIDYGISQGTKEDRMDQIVGSLMYMAPEQLDIDSTLDHRTDIYALGVLLHQMLTGITPYSSKKSKEDIIQYILNDPLERLIDIYPQVDNRLQEIIDIATSKNPDNRFKDCEDFINSLENISYAAN
ncbi:serine/threonine protein kinase [Flavobacteriaceae bacterium]|nr:serine/threonine protein kinase [Flavobacteriaceae bacterium]